MKITLSLRGCAIALALVLMPVAAFAQGARIRLDQLNHLAEKADEVVNVDVDPGMLQQAAKFLAGRGADTARVKGTIEGITGIYVRGFEFKAPHTYTQNDLEDIRKQLTGRNWSRVVSVKDKDEMTEIYFWREGSENGGLVVLAAEASELTVINIVGRVDLSSLAAMGYLIPKLPQNLMKK
jgi:Domain of unknown function (DUF4252)